MANAMGSGHFEGVLMRWGVLRRACVQRAPHQFVGGLLAGLVVSHLLFFLVLAYMQASTPIMQPTQQLISDTVPAGGYLGFVQGKGLENYCLQEHQRVVWRVNETTQRREMFTLMDFNPPPRRWNGPTVIYVRIPLELPPGPYFYYRQTQSWCSWLNVLTGRPTVEQTGDIPFHVVSPQVSASQKL